MAKAAHPLRQDLGRPSGRRAAGRHLPALHRPPSGARGDEPAGVRGPAPVGPQGARAGEDAAGGRPQRADHRPQPAQSRPGERGADRLSGRERQVLRARILRRVRQAAGHRARHRPGAGLHAARRHARVRRQPHRDPRRVRRARLWHRHVRSRACAGDADADPDQSRRTCARWSTASCRTASPPRTSSSPSSARSAPPAAPAMRWNMPAKRSARCRWKAA